MCEELITSQLLDESFVHPGKGFAGRALTRLVGSTWLRRFRRSLLGRLPFPKLESDVRNVVYLNWVVEVAAVRELVPLGVELWEREGRTFLTVLTYQHGHLGPALAGPFRRLFGSPFQSNWRLYVQRTRAHEAPRNTVLFLKNIMSSAGYAVGARLGTDVLPAHAAQSFKHYCHNGRWTTAITGGAGSAPDLHCESSLTAARTLTPALCPYFDSWDAAVRYLCIQDYSIAKVPDSPQLVESRIELPIDFGTVLPLTVAPEAFLCPALQPLVGVQTPLCFLVPQTKFNVLSERYL